MKIHSTALLFLASQTVSTSNAFTVLPDYARSVSTNNKNTKSNHGIALSTLDSTVDSSVALDSETDDNIATEMGYNEIQNLPYRTLQKECKKRGLNAAGNTGALRDRLIESFGIVLYSKADKADTVESVISGISFTDASDNALEYNDLLNEVMDKSSIGHWKAATRKLKKLKKRYTSVDRPQPVPRETYIAVLEACVGNLLHGARAAEPARKILEEMVEAGYEIPVTLANSCITSCIGIGPNGTHDGFGGIDTALAMLAALEGTSTVVNPDSYAALAVALSREDEESLGEALLILRSMIVDQNYTPDLSTFAYVSAAAAKTGTSAEAVMQVLTLVKASGYELDTIASAEPGRQVLASGVIAAEQLDNLALGLRLLTAAQRAEGCAPDRGDDLVAASSAPAQRACMLIHRRAIDKAAQDKNWKLAVKLLALMPQRSLIPSAGVWRRVVTLCAKCEKSRKACALLFDWVKLYEEGKSERPPIAVFNTVVNTCEICGEEELTLVVLESMKKTHEVEGNIITFNIALKRLAKQGQVKACEGIIVSMLEAGVEPTVVSYTTAIGACAKKGIRDSALAYEWLSRMRTRNVKPNFHTYNTALAACLDGPLECTIRASKIATMMLEDVDKELATGLAGTREYNSVLPDTYTKSLGKRLMKQLRENWRNDEINMKVAKATVRVSLLKLLDFDKSEAAERVKKQIAESESETSIEEEDSEENLGQVERDETEIEYAAVNSLHKDGRRNLEV